MSLEDCNTRNVRKSLIFTNIANSKFREIKAHPKISIPKTFNASVWNWRNSVTPITSSVTDSRKRGSVKMKGFTVCLKLTFWFPSSHALLVADVYDMRIRHSSSGCLNKKCWKRHKRNLIFKKILSPCHTFYKSNVNTPANRTNLFLFIIPGVGNFPNQTSLRTVFLLCTHKDGWLFGWLIWGLYRREPDLPILA